LAVVLILALLALGLRLAGTVAADGAPEQKVEQKVTPLTPQAEQRVQDITSAETQRVQMLDPQGVQDVSAPTPPGPGQKAASAVGKVALTVVAVGVSLGMTAASLLFF
jgi:hypothetical protein